MTQSDRNQLDGKITKIRPGLAVYKVKASPYYRARIWLPAKKRNVVKTTKVKNRIEAIEAAEELFNEMRSRGNLAATPKTQTFEHFADALVAQEKVNGETGKIYTRQSANTRNLLRHPKWGAVSYFKNRDINEIQTKEFNAYKAYVKQKDPSLSPGTLNHIAVAVRKVLQVAYSQGAIAAVPSTPREKRKDNPRPFFRFDPLVKKEDDEYKRLLHEARAMAEENVKVGSTVVTDELRDLIIFIAHSFVRPTQSELFTLRHSDVAVRTAPKRLTLSISKGKTGARITETMEAAASVYARIKARRPNHTPDDYLFMPDCKNRAQAQKYFQNQFKALLARCGQEADRSGGTHSLYSLRHTAICMRLVHSKGHTNIYTLAKNAGTSVEQIERFYAARLGLTQDMIKNLHSFGDA